MRNIGTNRAPRKKYKLVSGRVMAMTDKAVLIIVGDEKHWVPLSVCEEPNNIVKGDEELNIAEWWCTKHEVE